MKNHLSAIIIGLSIVAGCWLLNLAVGQWAYKDRCVTVKGLAEREVMADRVVWPLKFNEVGNDMMQLYTTIDSKQRVVIAFLKEHGVNDEEISISPTLVLDRMAQQWSSENIRDRYQTSCVITVTSGDVPKVLELMKMQKDLLTKGVAIGGEMYDNLKPEFFYQGLNDLKPQMVEEATHNARQVAMKFAADADCSLGSISRASQGQFSITSDATTPHIMNIRVVTTIDYYLR